MLKAARDEVLLPALDHLSTKLTTMAHTLAAVPMLSPHARPNRQPDHGRQGNRQRGGPARPGPRA